MSSLWDAASSLGLGDCRLLAGKSLSELKFCCTGVFAAVGVFVGFWDEAKTDFASFKGGEAAPLATESLALDLT